MTIRLGFYGAGLITQLHTWLLSESGEDHAIVAVHDPDLDRAQAFAAAHGARAVGEEELLDLVDAVYITTWTSEHPRLVAQVAGRGLPVLCEKPLAMDAASARAMADVVTRAGVVNQVGLILRFTPAFRMLRHLVGDERAGKVMTVVFRDDQFIPIQGHYQSTWRGDPARAGRGTLLEHSIHDVDILDWILGPITSVSASCSYFHGLEPIEDLAVARLEFGGGAAGTLTSVWHDVLERPSLRRVELFCERLHVTVEGDFVGPVRWQFAGEAEQVLEGDELIAALRDRGDDLPNPAASFLRAVAAGTPAWPDFGEAVRAHELVDAIYRSADAAGAPISV